LPVRTLGIALLLAAAVSAQRGSEDVPQWRGLGRDGAASAFVEPATWPETLTRRWRVEVGEGYASPLIVGPTVFVFSRQDRREVLRALDAATGAERWQSGYALDYTPSPPTAAHGAGPKATPLAHEGKVFTNGVSGIVAAFDAQTGTLLWRTNAPAEPPYFSAASSPLGLPGLVVVHPGNYEPLTALDASTGGVKWRTGAGGAFMSPILATLHGVAQVLSVTQAGVMGVSVSDGRMLWEYAWPGAKQGGIMPTVHGNEVVVSTAGSGVFAVRPTVRDGRWTVEKVWETAEVEMYLSHPVVVGETLYGFSTKARGQLFALDLRDGHTRWLGSPRQATNVAVTKAGGFLLLLQDDGELIVAWANNNAFDPVKRYRVGESATWAQPVVSGRRLLIRDGTALTMWEIR
jgi:outer membrane protein assembly factor BamB